MQKPSHIRQNCRIFYLLFKMSFGSSTIILLIHREDSCFTGQCSQKIEVVSCFFLNIRCHFLKKTHITMILLLCIYILSQHIKKYFETSQHRLIGPITVFPFSIWKWGREAFLSVHILVSLSDNNIQRILHSSSCGLAKFWVLFTG